MRAGGWPLMTATVLVWLLAAAAPVCAIALVLLSSDSTHVQVRPVGALLLTTLGWSAAVAACSVILGWMPGRLLGRMVWRRGFVAVAALCALPLALPSYLIFYAWWQSWPADSAIHRWLIAQQLVPWARQATLLLGLVCWSWPLVALCVAGFSAARPAQQDEMLRLDRASGLLRLLNSLRGEARGLALGALLAFLVTMNNTTCFDLAEVFTFANEVRAVEALGAGPRQIMVLAAPAMVVAAFGAMTVWLLLRRLPPRTVIRAAPPGIPVMVTAVLVWLATALAPIAMLSASVWNARGGGGLRAQASEFLTLYGWSMLSTVSLAAVSGAVAAAVLCGLTIAWLTSGAFLRRLADAAAITWLAVALMPATVLATSIHVAYNRGLIGEIVLGMPLVFHLIHLSCFGFVAALLARWVVSSEPPSLAALRRIDGATSVGALWQSSWPRLAPAAFAAFVIVTVLGLGEITVTARLSPPMPLGRGPIAATLLNDMHYQRPQTVLLAALIMMVAALLAAIAVAAAWRGATRLPVRPAALASTLCLALLVLPGCVPDADSAEPLRPLLAFGSPGTALGQFSYPRAIALDPVKQFVYVVDKTARVQRFGFDGEPQLQWRMPEMENGKPTGISVSPEGDVYVADTHYFRVIAYDRDGRELLRFGEFGTGPGQFIYVTDIAFGPQGRLYVSEYGGNDRVQVFSPAGDYLFQFGSFGRDSGQFNRPQSLAFNADRTELYIADACNHRIVVVSPEGRLLRTFGSVGQGPGQFAYPYGLDLLPDGTLLIAEFRNNRLQRVDPQGRCLELTGRLGRGPGELQYPWATASTHDRVFVLDSGNNRVQVIRTP